MVRKRRITKKLFAAKSTELTPVEFPFWEFLKKNFLYFFIGLIFILLLSAGIFFWKHLDKKNEEKASFLFYQAYQTYKKSKEDKKPWGEAIKLFQLITKDFPDTSASVLSYFYLGNCQFSMKKVDEAITSYKKFLDGVSSQPQLALLAYDNLGCCYEEKKDYKKALEYYQKTITPPPPGLGEIGYLNVGRCYEALGDIEGSLNLYKSFILKFPDSQKKNFFQEKIEIIESKHRAIEDATKKSP